jgi:hypothetical protein
MIQNAQYFLLKWSVFVKTKYLEHVGLLYCAISTITNFLLALLALWISSWAFIYFSGSPYTVTLGISLLCLSTILHNCFISQLPHTGEVLAVSESLGQTAAFSIFFWPLPLQGILLMLILLGTVSYYSGLIRITRLKKKGYIEHPEAIPE